MQVNESLNPRRSIRHCHHHPGSLRPPPLGLDPCQPAKLPNCSASADRAKEESAVVWATRSPALPTASSTVPIVSSLTAAHSPPTSAGALWAGSPHQPSAVARRHRCRFHRHRRLLRPLSQPLGRRCTDRDPAEEAKQRRRPSKGQPRPQPHQPLVCAGRQPSGHERQFIVEGGKAPRRRRGRRRALASA